MALPTRLKADVDLQLAPRTVRAMALDLACSIAAAKEFEMEAEEKTNAVLKRAEKFLEFLTKDSE